MFLLFLKPFLKVQVLVSLTTFISLVLTAVLLCSCVSSGLRHIPLVTSPANSTIDVRIGYLGICIDANCSTTNWGHINSTTLTTDISGNVALEFRDHAVRPYFIVMSLCAMLCSYIVGLMSLCVGSKMNLNPVSLALLALSWGSSVISAVWQEVAVHASVVFLETVKGSRASGMAWATVALLTVAVIGQALKRRTIDPSIDLPEKV